MYRQVNMMYITSTHKIYAMYQLNRLVGIIVNYSVFYFIDSYGAIKA